MTRPLCLVTGATGAVGAAIVEAVAPTHDVRTLSRRPPAPDLFPVPVTAVTGDVADASAVRRAVEGVDAVVHLAALLHIVNPPPHLRGEYERVNVHGTAAVLDAARQAGVSRVVLMSTIAVYGHAGRRMLTEASPPAPDTFYGETKLAAERLALAAERADGTPLATVLRSAAVYGPRVKGNYQRLVLALSRGRFVPIGPGDNLRTLVHESDLAAAAALAVSDPGAAGRVYNVTDGAPHPLREIITAICDGLGRRPPRWHAPMAPIRVAMRAAGLLDARLPRMLDKYLEEVAVDGSLIQAELGFRPRYGLTEGWRATIDAMRREGTL